MSFNSMSSSSSAVPSVDENRKNDVPEKGLEADATLLTNDAIYIMQSSMMGVANDIKEVESKIAALQKTQKLGAVLRDLSAREVRVAEGHRRFLVKNKLAMKKQVDLLLTIKNDTDQKKKRGDVMKRIS